MTLNTSLDLQTPDYATNTANLAQPETGGGLIPGINVGNALLQLGSYVGLAPQGDYNIFDNLTVSDRPGETVVNPFQTGFGTTAQPVSPFTAPNPTTSSTTYNPYNPYTDPNTYATAPTQDQINIQQAQTLENSRLAAGTSQFNTGISNIYNSSMDSAGNMLGSGDIANRQSILDWIRGQRGIDQNAVQNESSRIQGGRDIMSMIGRGIKSGGVMLGNKNAGNSSAAEAIANAYGQLGRQQMSTIGNQYATNADKIMTAQTDQDTNMALAKDKYKQDLVTSANNIAAAAEQQLIALDTQMANASLPNRVSLAQEKERIKANALAKLKPLETQLMTGLEGIKATGLESNRAKANTMLGAGQADPNLFKYTTQAPMQFTGQQAPAGGQLPIYTYNGKNKTQLA